MSLAEDVYRLTSRFPKSEIYGLTSQARRAVVSIAANIAEGYGRDNDGSFVQFLRIAQGSLKELETHLLISVRIGCAEAAAIDAPMARCDEIGKMLRSLIRWIQKRQAGG